MPVDFQLAAEHGELARRPAVETVDTGLAMPGESATHDLVELTRRMFDAANRRDLDVTQSFYAPDAVWETMSLGTSFEGVAAIRGFLEDWLSAYEEYVMQPEEIVDLGNGVVFVVVRLTARPIGSVGSALVRRRPIVFAWVEGMVARVTAYADSVDAGRAAAERLAASRG
jgi:ketosteroid isomerase-like protein